MRIYVFNRQVLYDELSGTRFVDFAMHLFPVSISRYHVNAYIVDGYPEDIGTIKSFQEGNLLLARLPWVFSFWTDRGVAYTLPL